MVVSIFLYKKFFFTFRIPKTNSILGRSPGFVLQHPSQISHNSSSRAIVPFSGFSGSLMDTIAIITSISFNSLNGTSLVRISWIMLNKQNRIQGHHSHKAPSHKPRYQTASYVVHDSDRNLLKYLYRKVQSTSTWHFHRVKMFQSP